MPWLRMGDTAAMHPKVLGVLELDDADDRLLNEAFGFVARCATLAAAHQTDYVVTVGTARAIAGMSRYKALLAASIACGLLAEVTVPGEDGGDPVRAYRLVQDPDLMHMRLKDEVEWDRQRKRDVADTTLTGPVRARDGDACRYCGRTVNWKDRRGARGGTYDHVHPGEAATVDTLVVACKACNSARQDNAERLQLLPVPAKKIIGPVTAEWLTKDCGIPTRATYTTPAQLDALAKASVQAAAEQRAQDAEPEPTSLSTPTDNAAIREAAFQRLRDGAARAAEAVRARAGAESPEPAPDEESRDHAEEKPSEADLQVQQVPADPSYAEAGFLGSGRDGTVRAGPGTGLDGAGRAGSGRAGSGGRQRDAPRGQVRGEKSVQVQGRRRKKGKRRGKRR